MPKRTSQYQAISNEFDALTDRETLLANECEALKRSQCESKVPIDQEIEAAMALFEKLTQSPRQPADYLVMRDVFALVNLRLFLRFEPGQWGKQKIQKIASGVITLGPTPPPVKIYEGKTGRSALKEVLGHESGSCHGGDCTSMSDGKEDSLGNVSRGDWI